MKLTLAETYVATQYEAAVDQQLDVEALRRFLLEQGIRKTPAQVVDELENTFGFLGYASLHPAPQNLMQRLVSRIIPKRFIPQPRKSLRSPKRMKRWLRWASQTDRRIAYMLIIGWMQLLSALLLTYFLLTAPERPDVGPVLENLSKGATLLLAYSNFYFNSGDRTKKSWRARRRKERGREMRALAARIAERESDVTSLHLSMK